MKPQLKSLVLTVTVGMLAFAPSAFAGPPQQVPEAGATSALLLVLALAGLGLTKALAKK